MCKGKVAFMATGHPRFTKIRVIGADGKLRTCDFVSVDYEDGMVTDIVNGYENIPIEEYLAYLTISHTSSTGVRVLDAEDENKFCVEDILQKCSRTSFRDCYTRVIIPVWKDQEIKSRVLKWCKANKIQDISKVMFVLFGELDGLEVVPDGEVEEFATWVSEFVKPELVVDTSGSIIGARYCVGRYV